MKNNTPPVVENYEPSTGIIIVFLFLFIVFLPIVFIDIGSTVSVFILISFLVFVILCLIVHETNLFGMSLSPFYFRGKEFTDFLEKNPECRVISLSDLSKYPSYTRGLYYVPEQIISGEYKKHTFSIENLCFYRKTLTPCGDGLSFKVRGKQRIAGDLLISKNFLYTPLISGMHKVYLRKRNVFCVQTNNNALEAKEIQDILEKLAPFFDKYKKFRMAIAFRDDVVTVTLFNTEKFELEDLNLLFYFSDLLDGIPRISLNKYASFSNFFPKVGLVLMLLVILPVCVLSLGGIFWAISEGNYFIGFIILETIASIYFLVKEETDKKETL